MSNSSALPRRSAIVLAVLASLVFACASAASASAFEWVQGETDMRWSGDEFTLEKEGSEPVTCYFEPTYGSLDSGPFGPVWGAREGGYGGVENGEGYFGYASAYDCDGGTEIELTLVVGTEAALGEDSFTLGMLGPTGLYFESPFGYYNQAGLAEGTFTNGSEGQASSLSFEDAEVGYTYETEETISITGTFEVTQADGSLLTLED